MTPLERFAAKRAREKEARQRKAAERREAIEDQYAEVADIIERETISQKILQMLKQDFGAHPEWLGRLPRLAQVAEKVLFWDHEEWRDFEAYTDTTTLRARLDKLECKPGRFIIDRVPTTLNFSADILQQLNIMRMQQYQQDIKHQHQQRQKRLEQQQRRLLRKLEREKSRDEKKAAAAAAKAAAAAAEVSKTWLAEHGRKSKLLAELRRKRGPPSDMEDDCARCRVYNAYEAPGRSQTEGLAAAREGIIEKIKDMIRGVGNVALVNYEEKLSDIAKGLERKLKAPDRGDTLLAEYVDLDTLKDRLQQASKAFLGHVIAPLQ